MVNTKYPFVPSILVLTDITATQYKRSYLSEFLIQNGIYIFEYIFSLMFRIKGDALHIIIGLNKFSLD